MEPATLEFDPPGFPRSRKYGDIYFSPHGGLEESRSVFLAGNFLPERWRGRETFTVGELGFGTGLNFLATWQCWKQDPQAPARLHYLSCENHPIPPQKLKACFQNFPELHRPLEELIEQIPPPVAGFHRLSFQGGRVLLTLLFGDAQEVWPQVQGKVDAWYLDGFAPGLNPKMWQEKLFHSLANKTAKGGTFATYSSASRVRRALMAAGFKVEKLPGFGGKREMLRGSLANPPEGER
ncbi:MAG: tRNA (5-methylaminomethyl-2-thiouridine)(34)-methyltransferase MnmD, partial [bacterium]|nr:tRNA (5-methylaminomethyl-2-thiouridine)(34)-methyltransferase MnmD [bacterium]